MAGEWQPVSLGEVSDLLTGFPFRSEQYVDDPAAPRLVRGDNVAHGVLRWDGAKRWPIDGLDDVAAYELREGDVILAMDRPWIEAGLKCGSVRRSDLPCLLVQRVARIRGTDRLDTGYLKHLIASQAFTEHVLAVQTGTAIPHISGAQIKGFEFRLPPVSEQRAIAHILGTLDDKIELNRQMSQTLEAMARALFKSWFVDFDPVRAKSEGRDTGLPEPIADLFPDSFEDSTLGEIPRGWSVGTLGDVAEHPRRSVRPNEIEAETAYFALEHMPMGNVALAHWGHAEGLESNKYRFARGEILFGKLRPYFRKVGVAPVDGVCSTDIVVLRPKTQPWFGYVLGHASSGEFVDYTNAGSTGTKMPRTSWKEMARYEVALSPESVAGVFSAMVQPVVDRIIEAIHESRTLAALRDALLPKLISGELRIAGARRIGNRDF